MAVELAALVLSSRTFKHSVEESNKVWTGSLEADHRRALEPLKKERDVLRESMSGCMNPEQLTEYLKFRRISFWNSSARAPRRNGFSDNRRVNPFTGHDHACG
jgi:hypothetical protein